MTVEGETLDPEDGLKPLRNSVADGGIEGESYVVTLGLSSGDILVEFDDETIVYSISDLVRDAYALVYEDNNGGEPA